MTENTPKTIITSITSKELSKSLLDAEAKTRASLKSFLIAGEQLNYINKNELYLERGFVRWTDYVQEIFDIQASYSYKLINAYGVVEALKELGFSGTSLPQTESQCRPMVRLFESLDETPVCLRDVWMRVIMADGKVTAAKIEASVNVELGKLNTKKTVESGKPGTKGVEQDNTNKDKSQTDDILDLLENTPGSGAGVAPKDATIETVEKEKTMSMAEELSSAKLEILRLRSELEKARKQGTGHAPRSKMAIELYKAGFRALAATIEPERMDELIALKSSLIG